MLPTPYHQYCLNLCFEDHLRCLTLEQLQFVAVAAVVAVAVVVAVVVVADAANVVVVDVVAWHETELVIETSVVVAEGKVLETSAAVEGIEEFEVAVETYKTEAVPVVVDVEVQWIAAVVEGGAWFCYPPWSLWKLVYLSSHY